MPFSSDLEANASQSSWIPPPTANSCQSLSTAPIGVRTGWLRRARRPEPGFSKPVLADEVPLHVEDKLTAMRDPDTAAHVVGKLVTHIGEKNVLYGSDSIRYGSPQDQIQAFRKFKISDAFQHKYGYPEMTPELRARIFGLSGDQTVRHRRRRSD